MSFIYKSIILLFLAFSCQVNAIDLNESIKIQNQEIFNLQKRVDERYDSLHAVIRSEAEKSDARLRHTLDQSKDTFEFTLKYVGILLTIIALFFGVISCLVKEQLGKLIFEHSLKTMTETQVTKLVDARIQSDWQPQLDKAKLKTRYLSELVDKVHAQGVNADLSMTQQQALSSSSISNKPLRQRTHSDWSLYGLDAFAKKDYENAYECYRKALDFNEDDSVTHDAIGVCAMRISKFDVAKESFAKAVKLAPTNPDFSGNYAQYLLGVGEDKDGDWYLESAIRNAGNRVEMEILKTEIYFYQYCHFKKPTALIELKKLINQNVRSIGWDFSINLKRMRKEKVQNIKFLEELARVISEDANVDGLEQYPEWVSAN